MNESILGAGLALAAGFLLICKLVKRRRDIEKDDQETTYRKRMPSEEPHNRKKEFWLTQWGQMLCEYFTTPPGPDTRKGKLFRRRFRLPYPVFFKLMGMCREKQLFGPGSCNETDITGRKICPFPIKLLGVLRILGRGWTFDDVAEATGMGEATVQKSFHLFCSNFVFHYYNTYVYRPEGEELQRDMEVYRKLGLPGCASRLLFARANPVDKSICLLLFVPKELR